VLRPATAEDDCDPDLALLAHELLQFRASRR
jgi:hypothetical protein